MKTNKTEIDKLWGTKGVDGNQGIITEKEALGLCKQDIEGKMNNRIGLKYKIQYMPVVVGVDRYDNIQDVSTVMISKLLGKEYIEDPERRLKV